MLLNKFIMIYYYYNKNWTVFLTLNLFVSTFFLSISVIALQQAKRTKIPLCHHRNQTHTVLMEVMERLRTHRINMPARNRASTVIHSMAKVISISIRIGSIHRVVTVVTINGVDMEEDTAIELLLSRFFFIIA